MTQGAGSADAARHGLRGRIEQLLQVDPSSKPRIYLQLFEASDSASLNYWIELLLSAGIATFGLVLNSPAVVIGAMLISPLMGPILALGLALALADVYLGARAAVTLMISVGAAVAFSAAIVWLLPFHDATAEILARTEPTLLDLGVALLSGLAGSLVVARGGGGGGVTALPGVAIAVALMPPLCAMGFGVGAGFVRPIVSGAILLFVTNLAAIMAMAFVTFLIVGMDTAEVRRRITVIVQQEVGHDRLYLALMRTVVAKPIGDVGKLRWRVLMIVTVLGALFVPLRSGLLRVKDETVARTAARNAVRQLLPADRIVSEQTEVGVERILVNLVATAAVDPLRLERAERSMLLRTGKEATITVRTIADEGELAVLRQHLQSRPTPAAPAPFSLDTARTEALTLLAAPLKEAWPGAVAELAGSELGFDSDGIVVRLRYRAAAPLDDSAALILTNVLKARLGVAALRLDLVNEQPSPPPPTRRRARPAPR